MRDSVIFAVTLAVRKNASLACLLLAWLCANGALLDVVQVVAWGKMFAGYNATLSVGAALRATFDPAKPCELCVGVARAKDAAQNQLPAAPERATEKLLLACEAPAAVVWTAPASDWPAERASVAPLRAEPVPVPPPRV
mgnify:CR=1 FL=1